MLYQYLRRLTREAIMDGLQDALEMVEGDGQAAIAEKNPAAAAKVEEPCPLFEPEAKQLPAPAPEKTEEAADTSLVQFRRKRGRPRKEEGQTDK